MGKIVTQYTYLNKYIDLSKYIVTRKYNGIQGIWDGKGNMQTIGRGGKPHDLVVPNEWAKGLPNLALRGELWHWRDDLDSSKIILRKHNIDWGGIQFIPFAINNSTINNEVAWTIIKNLGNYKSLTIPYEFRNKSIKVIKSLIYLHKWEGFVAHLRNAYYKIGLTDTVFKWVMSFNTEVEVIGYTLGKNKYTGMIGALKVKTTWSNNVDSITGGTPEFRGKTIKFKVSSGLSDEDRNFSPRYRIGSRHNLKFARITSSGTPFLGRIV